jgi:urease accessory protein
MKITKHNFRIITVLLLLLPVTAFAHEGEGVASGFVSGFTHPLFGPDHVIAMIAVGLWGGILGKPAIWMLPVAFPVVMALGGMLGIIGVPIPYVESGIAISGLVLGLLVALMQKMPLWFAATIVSLFGLFHGYAHGVELPNSVTPIAYSIGFVISTGLLHICGIVIGLLIDYSWGKPIVRILGALIALTGLYFLVL